MKKSRYSESQIMTILKQAEPSAPVPALCREHGMSSACFYQWRAKFGGIGECKYFCVTVIVKCNQLNVLQIQS